MKRLALIMITCLCALIALPAAFAAETKKQGPEAKPAVAKPAAPATKYKEAPALAALVKAGKLPAVEKRLPDKPDRRCGSLHPGKDSCPATPRVRARGFAGALSQSPASSPPAPARR